MGALNILNPFLHSDKYIMLLIRVLEISLEKPMSHSGLGNRFGVLMESAIKRNVSLIRGRDFLSKRLLY